MRIFLIVLALVVGWPSGLIADQIDECGRIYTRAGCHEFHPLDPPSRVYELSGDYGREGQVVHLSGEVVECWASCGSTDADSCLTNVTVSDCPPRDLGCGIIDGAPEEFVPCCTWESFLFGDIELAARYCQFGHGDTVHVFGRLDYVYNNPICLFGLPSLADGIVTACADSAVQVAPITWGSVKAHYR